MINYLIIHGACGSPLGNWFPWLQKELANKGAVYVPSFPTPEGQNLNAWLNVANAALKNSVAEDTVLIGHSSGAVLALRMAEQTKKPYKAIFSVCPFARDLGLDFDSLNRTFVHPKFDWAAVKAGAKTITCYAGDDDPYVPLAYSKEIADAIDAELVVVSKGGHLNADSGMLEFPLLLSRINALTSNKPSM